MIPLGTEGVPHIFVYPKSYFFGDLKPHAKFPKKSNNLGEKREKLRPSLWCKNNLFLRFLLLNNLNRTALKLRSSSIYLFFIFLKSFSIILGGCLSSWVKIKLNTKNQLPRLPQSGLKVPGWWWFPNHYQVKLQLMMRLSWAVSIKVPSFLP